MDITILLESIIIGAIVGIAVGAGAARMFHAPEVQAAGAFRTMGEMNACMGDPISHISFGFSFFVNTMVTTWLQDAWIKYFYIELFQICCRYFVH